MKEFYDTGLNIVFYEIKSVNDLKKIKDRHSDVFITVRNTGNFNKYSGTIKVLDRMISGHYPGASIAYMGKDSFKVLIRKDEFPKIFKEMEKNHMIDKAKNEFGIVSYKVKSVDDLTKINDACEIRIMVDVNNSNARKIIVDAIHKKWPNNLDINEIPMPGGIYIMIPESLAKETAKRADEFIIKAFDKDEYNKWHAEMRKYAKVITSAIFSNMNWKYDELLEALKFIIDSKNEKGLDMKPEDCLEMFDLNGLQSINLIYWGLRLNALGHIEDNEKLAKMLNAASDACDILFGYAKETIKNAPMTVLDLIHMLADDKKDENGDFIDINYEYFGVYGMQLMHYLKGPNHVDYTDEFNELIDSYNIMAEGPYIADAWDIIYKNYINIYKARHNEDDPDNNPLFTFANSFREWIIFSEIFKTLNIEKSDIDNRYRYYQICMNNELYKAIYLNINSMQISDFLTKYEYQVYCATKSDTNSMQIEPMLILLLRFYDSIHGWKNYMNTTAAYQPEVKNFDDTLDFLIKNCKSKYLGYLAKRYL